VGAEGVARVAGQSDSFAGLYVLVHGDQHLGQVGVDGVILAAISPVPNAHVEAVGIAVVGPDVEHFAVRAGVDIGPDRRPEVKPLVAGLVIFGVDVRVLAKVLRDDMVVHGPPQPEFAGHNSSLVPSQICLCRDYTSPMRPVKQIRFGLEGWGKCVPLNRASATRPPASPSLPGSPAWRSRAETRRRERGSAPRRAG